MQNHFCEGIQSGRAYGSPVDQKDSAHVLNASKQVLISKEELAKQEIQLGGDRRADLIDGNTLREQKAVSGRLGQRDLEQFDDFMELVERQGGAQIMVQDKVVTIEQVVYTFTDPRGVQANSDWMRKQLTIRNNLSFEVFNSKGESCNI